MQMSLIEDLKERIDRAQLWHKEITLSRGDFLKTSGSTDTNLYYIESGSLRVFFEDEYEEQTIRLGYRKNFIAALDSFLSESSSDLYIQAIKKSQVKVMTKVGFQKFVQSDPLHFKLWNQILEQLVYQQLEREKDILTYSPRERYKRVLRRSPQLFQEIPHKYIASYLRITPETLSRIKKP